MMSSTPKPFKGIMDTVSRYTFKHRNMKYRVNSTKLIWKVQFIGHFPSTLDNLIWSYILWTKFPFSCQTASHPSWVKFSNRTNNLLQILGLSSHIVVWVLTTFTPSQSHPNELNFLNSSINRFETNKRKLSTWNRLTKDLNLVTISGFKRIHIDRWVVDIIVEKLY